MRKLQNESSDPENDELLRDRTTVRWRDSNEANLQKW